MEYSQNFQEATQSGPPDPAPNTCWNRIRGFRQRAGQRAWPLCRTMASISPPPPETPRPAPATPASSEGAGNSHMYGFPPPPSQGSIAASRYSPPPRHVPYADRCYSLGMSRVYDDTLRCDKCGRDSDFGWFYRCTNEVETRLYESIREGNIEHFDETGAIFSLQLKQPIRGPAARADKLSLLNELEPEELESLSGPQLARLLRQRESANAAALNDKFGFLAPAVQDQPYRTSELQECKNTLCPHCGKGMVGEEMAFLNLDGVLRGDIPPTVAVGYSFRKHGRPVADAEIVRNIGLRPVPEAKSESSKLAQDDEMTPHIHQHQPLATSSFFITNDDSNEDLLELYTDEHSGEIAREDDGGEGL